MSNSIVKYTILKSPLFLAACIVSRQCYNKAQASNPDPSEPRLSNLLKSRSGIAFKTLLSDRMDNFSEIEKVVGGVSLAAKDRESNYDGAANPSSTKTVRSLQGIMNALMSDNIELKKRLSAVEAKVATMDAGFMSQAAPVV